MSEISIFDVWKQIEKISRPCDPTKEKGLNLSEGHVRGIECKEGECKRRKEKQRCLMCGGVGHYWIYNSRLGRDRWLAYKCEDCGNTGVVH